MKKKIENKHSAVLYNSKKKYGRDGTIRVIATFT